MHPLEGFLCLLADRLEMKVDVINALLPIRQGDKGEVYINGISGQVLQKQVDGGSSVNGKHAFFHHYRDKAEQQFYFLGIYLSVDILVIHILQALRG